MYRQWLGCVMIGLLMTSGCLAVVEPDIFEGEDINRLMEFSPFTLHDQHAANFSSSSLNDTVVVVHFMFTNCYDVCSTQTQDLAAIHEQYTERVGVDLEFISITVDPWRDDAVALSDYSQVFNTSWPMLTVPFLNDENLSLIERVWTEFGVQVTLIESEESTTIQGRGHTVYYNVEHTDGVLLLDFNGLQRVRWTSDTWNATGIANDIELLLGGV